MNKFAVDYNSLKDKLNTKRHYKYSDVKHKLVKVAYDIVKFEDGGGIDGLWQIQKTDEGDVIVAMYSDSNDEKKALSSNWSVLLDKTASVANIFYKDEYVKKIASSEVEVENFKMLAEILPETLNENSNLREKMLSSLSSDDKEYLINKFPELKREVL